LALFPVAPSSKEACALQTVVDAGADTEAELERLKEQWVMKEHTLGTLATGNSRDGTK
jgi:hypothetical protein